MEHCFVERQQRSFRDVLSLATAQKYVNKPMKIYASTIFMLCGYMCVALIFSCPHQPIIMYAETTQTHPGLDDHKGNEYDSLQYIVLIYYYPLRFRGEDDG